MAVANKAHIPGAQGPLLGLRIAQLVLAIIILGLSAYGVYWLVYDGDALTLSSVRSVRFYYYFRRSVRLIYPLPSMLKTNIKCS